MEITQKKISDLIKDGSLLEIRGYFNNLYNEPLSWIKGNIGNKLITEIREKGYNINFIGEAIISNYYRIEKIIMIKPAIK